MNATVRHLTGQIMENIFQSKRAQGRPADRGLVTEVTHDKRRSCEMIQPPRIAGNCVRKTDGPGMAKVGQFVANNTTVGPETLIPTRYSVSQMQSDRG